MANSNAVELANYAKAVRALETKRDRQVLAVEATNGQIAGFKALIAQLEKQK